MQTFPVFAYICKSIGETLDSCRFDEWDNNDLHEAVCKYNNYKVNRGETKEPFKTYFESDKQLKRIPISLLDKDSNWIIENFWSEQEKIEIGIKKENIMSTIDDFQALIDETIYLMSSFKEELECLK